MPPKAKDASSPETSIVIRALDEEKHIGNLLEAIARQEYTDYEIIVVDSGSVDKTLDIVQRFPVDILCIERHDFTFGYSLNVGCKKAQGKYLVFASAHVLPVDSKWLGNLVAPFKNERVAMVYGRQAGDEGAKFSEKRDLSRLFGEDSFDSSEILDYANNANSAVRKALWEQYPFDEYLFGLEDIDWARHFSKEGYLVHYAPEAAVYHIHRENWNQIYNRYRREAIAAQRIGLSHPPQASPSAAMAVLNVVLDLFASVPNLSPQRVNEVLKFRYHQWRGCYRGWYRDRALDLDRERHSIFFPAQNPAVVITAAHGARIESIEVPQMRPGDLLLRVEYVGVCRTDLEVFEGTLGYYKQGLAHYPIVPGHEFCGTVVKIGASTKYREKFKVGEMVVGECILSRSPEDRKEVGVVNYNGAYAQFLVIPGAFVHKVPPDVDPRALALAEPLAVALRALRRIEERLTKKSEVAILGAGPIGNLCAQVLSLRGHKVAVFDKQKERLKHLEEIVAVSKAIEGLAQFDIIIEATGSLPVLQKALKESRAESTLLLLGFPYGDMSYNFEDVVGNEKIIVGSVGAQSQDFPEALRLLPSLNLEPFIETILPLSDFKKAWKLQKGGKHLKILLKP